MGFWASAFGFSFRVWDVGFRIAVLVFVFFNLGFLIVGLGCRCRQPRNLGPRTLCPAPHGPLTRTINLDLKPQELDPKTLNPKP